MWRLLDWLFRNGDVKVTWMTVFRNGDVKVTWVTVFRNGDVKFTWLTFFRNGDVKVTWLTVFRNGDVKVTWLTVFRNGDVKVIGYGWLVNDQLLKWLVRPRKKCQCQLKRVVLQIVSVDPSYNPSNQVYFSSTLSRVHSLSIRVWSVLVTIRYIAK